MNSTDILCGELCTEFNREYGFFTSSISGASGILRGYVFSEFRKTDWFPWAHCHQYADTMAFLEW